MVNKSKIKSKKDNLRIVEVAEIDEEAKKVSWIRTRLVNVNKGNIFRMWEGKKLLNNCNYLAIRNGFIADDGIAAIDAETIQNGKN